jgi:deoxyadenosine/deoxycytidine kinase
VVNGVPVNELISIVGASGVGKTSLVRALAGTGRFATALESHTDRPFQILFKEDKRYGLANQIDYFLLRAEQERELRAASQIGLMDGGLDLDFHCFTRLFLSRNLLAEPEYELCRRVYTFIRGYLPRPELFVRLAANEGTIASRLATRDRINIARAEDTALFNSFLDEWLSSLPSDQVLKLDVSHETLEYEESKRAILEYLNFSKSRI